MPSPGCSCGPCRALTCVPSLDTKSPYWQQVVSSSAVFTAGVFVGRGARVASVKDTVYFKLPLFNQNTQYGGPLESSHVSTWF